MIDYPKDKKVALAVLAEALTSKGDLLNSFLNEIGENTDLMQAMLSGQRSISTTVENFCSTIEEIADGALKAKTAIIEDIRAKRECLFEEFEFIADVKKNAQGMTTMHRLYLLDYKRKQEGKQAYYTAVTFSSQLAPISRMVNKAESIEQLKAILQDNSIDVV